MFSSPHENIIVNYSCSYCCCESGEDTLYSVSTDHLGSWKTVINETTLEVYQQSFDAWGRHRNPQNWNSSVCSAFPFDRGYTGHQHLDEFGLINMNGRMYDVGLCRFLSPDPYVQAPDFTQNFNRYSYCLNNPLNYIDPTGYTAYKKYMDALYGEGNYNYRGSARGTWGKGEGNGSITNVYSLPGWFGNGSGLNGVYYNWSTGEYRSIGDQNSVVPWSYVSGIVSEYSINTELTFQGRGNIKSNGSIALNNSGEVNVFKYWEVGGASARNIFSESRSWFNSPVARNMIPDVMTIEVSGVLSFMGGAGIDFGGALVTRGIHAGSLYVYKTQRAKAGFHGGVSVNGGGSRYTGAVEQFDFENLFEGYSASIEGDYSFFGGSIGRSNNNDNYGDYLISADIGLGLGFGGSVSIGEKTNIIHFLTIW